MQNHLFAPVRKRRPDDVGEFTSHDFAYFKARMLRVKYQVSDDILLYVIRSVVPRLIDCLQGLQHLLLHFFRCELNGFDLFAELHAGVGWDWIRIASGVLHPGPCGS